jgi:pyrroline-5-carboxylate reductase
VTTLEVISDQIKAGSLLVSLLAGIKSESIESLLPKNVRVVRVMPNTPLLISNGMSVVTGGSSAIESDIAWVQDLMSKSGKVLVMKEKDMDAVTATSGSGPAYFFAVVEAMISAATRLGLDESSARTLVSQTFLGAAAMLKESGKDAKELRENVTSPNGTTAAALKVFSTNKLDEIVYEAMKAAHDRSIELSN